MDVQKQIFLVLTRKHGLKVSPTALDFLLQVFEKCNLSREQLAESLDFIAFEYVSKVSIEDAPLPVQKDLLQSVIADIFRKNTLSRSEELGNTAEITSKEAAGFIRVLNTFETPRYTYQTDNRIFHKVPHVQSLVADAAIRTQGYKDLFDLIKQRVLRNEAFRPPSLSANENSFFNVIMHLIIRLLQLFT